MNDIEKSIARNYLKNHDLSNISTENLQNLSSNPRISRELKLALDREINTRLNKPGSSKP